MTRPRPSPAPDDGLRAARMQRRVEAAAEAVGLGPDGARLVALAHTLAMDARMPRLPDDHHPDYLHPGRTGVILMEDLELADPVAVAAGELLDTERSDLEVPSASVKAMDGAVAAFRGSVPRPGDPDLTEALVTASARVRLVALAERLDHLRHAHLWPDVEQRREAHDEALRVYAPTASRTHPKLARRYAWWCRMFERRYLG